MAEKFKNLVDMFEQSVKKFGPNQLFGTITRTGTAQVTPRASKNRQFRSALGSFQLWTATTH